MYFQTVFVEYTVLGGANKLQCLDIYPGTELYRDFIVGDVSLLKSIRLRANRPPLNRSVVHPGAFRNIRNLQYVYVDSAHAWHSTTANIALYDTISLTDKRQDTVIWVSTIVTSYTAPTSVLKIADYTFSNSSALTNVDFSACSPTLIISKYAFTGNSATFTIKVPFASTSTQASNAPWGAVNATIIYQDS